MLSFCSDKECNNDNNEEIYIDCDQCCLAFCSFHISTLECDHNSRYICDNCYIDVKVEDNDCSECIIEREIIETKDSIICIFDENIQDLINDYIGA